MMLMVQIEITSEEFKRLSDIQTRNGKTMNETVSAAVKDMVEEDKQIEHMLEDLAAQHFEKGNVLSA